MLEAVVSSRWLKPNTNEKVKNKIMSATHTSNTPMVREPKPVSVSLLCLSEAVELS